MHLLPLPASVTARAWRSLAASCVLLAACPKPSTDDTDTDIEDTDIEDTDLPPTPITGAVRIFDECGPADGPALVLSPGQTDDMCYTVNDRTPMHPYRLYLVSNLPQPGSLPHTLTLGADLTTDGTATWCPTFDGCVTATSGSVTFTAYEHGVTAVGTFEFTLPGGEVRTGTFDAGWCEHMIMCG